MPENEASKNAPAASAGARTDSAQSSAKAGLPVWSKVLIALVVLGFSAGLLLCGSGIVLVRDLTLKSIDPQYIASAAQQIAQFPNPLPPGFEYKTGVSLGPIAVVKVEHAASKQQILLMTAYDPDKAGLDDEKLLAKEFDIGINTPFMSAKFKDLKKKGQEQLDGITMPYMVGKAEDQLDRLGEGMIGYIKVGPHKTVKVYALQPEGELALDITFELLKKIKWV